MRTSIKEISANEVWVRVVENDVVTLKIALMAPAAGGAVRTTDGKQICRKLFATGETLYWGGGEPLVKLIRREARARRAAFRREDREHRTLEFCVAECVFLAKQLKEIKESEK